MNREKILDIAMKLPREAYIDLLCAGVIDIWSFSCIQDAILRYKNISYNQAKALIQAYEEPRKEDKDE